MSLMERLEQRLLAVARRLPAYRWVNERRQTIFDRVRRGSGGRAGQSWADRPTIESNGDDLRNVHSDERTIRRVAEAELGGQSSEESREAYDRGQNRGGLHHGGHGPTGSHHGETGGEEQNGDVKLPN